MLPHHRYCSPTNNTDAKSWRYLCGFVVNSGFKAMKKNLHHLQLGGFLTEFGE